MALSTSCALAPSSGLSASTCHSGFSSLTVISFRSGKRAFPGPAALSFAGKEVGDYETCDPKFRRSTREPCFQSVSFLVVRRGARVCAAWAVSTGTAERTGTEASGGESASTLITELHSLTKDSDRGARLEQKGHGRVGEVVTQIESYGIPEPLKSPLIFGDWDVTYSSNPTSPGGGYRTWLGRLIFRTRDMIQTIAEPDVVVNVVRFALFGFIRGQVTLKGKLTPLDKKMVQVDFQPPDLQIGPIKFSYGGNSMVNISIIYLDEKLRLGRGSRGTVFVFSRR